MTQKRKIDEPYAKSNKIAVIVAIIILLSILTVLSPLLFGYGKYAYFKTKCGAEPLMGINTKGKNLMEPSIPGLWSAEYFCTKEDAASAGYR